MSGRHSIEAGYARGIFWRQAPFVEVGEPVVWNKFMRGKVLENARMTEMCDVTGDEPQGDEQTKLMIADAMYVINALLGKEGDNGS